MRVSEDVRESRCYNGIIPMESQVAGASFTVDDELVAASALDPAGYPQAGRTGGRAHSEIRLARLVVGDGTFTVIAGPCAIEGYQQFGETAKVLKALGVKLIRGGAFKPRTSPYSFQGLQREGLAIISQVKAETGLCFVTELMSSELVEEVTAVADVVQIGSRNMQNFPLLKVAGKLNIPVLLKRGFGNTLHELLMAAEYIMNEGNQQVILCERGIRTFDPAQRNTLDLMAVPILKSVTHLPVIVDPSHALGKREFVPQAVKAALAVGADGVLVEVHPRPEEALSDGRQSITPQTLAGLIGELKPLAAAAGRELA